MDFKITRKSHILALLDSVGIVSIVFIIGTIIIYYFEGFQFILSTIWIFVLGLILLILPALYLYLEFYLHDRNLILSVDHKKHELSYKRKGFERRIAFNDIILFEIFGEVGSYYWCPSSAFSFARLVLKNGEEFFFTRLIEYKLENIIPFVRIEKRRWLFPSIHFYKLVRSNDDIPSSCILDDDKN